MIAFSQSKSFVLIVEGMLTSSIGGMAAGFGLFLLLLLLVLLLFLLLEVIVLSLPSEFWLDDFSLVFLLDLEVLLEVMLDLEVLDPPLDLLEVMVDPWLKSSIAC